jgi:hypothetical protein
MPEPRRRGPQPSRYWPPGELQWQYCEKPIPARRVPYRYAFTVRRWTNLPATTCGRRARHDGPCSPRRHPADMVDRLLLDRWPRRRPGRRKGAAR